MSTSPQKSSSSSSSPSSSYSSESVPEWVISFAASMVPISTFCYAHHRGLSLTILNGVYRRTGVYGFLALPFFTLAMEKSVYDTVQAAQGKDVTDVVHSGEKNRERPTFPSGGGQALPSFSLIPVWKRDK
mmetsp:Transcript_19524/g.40456  ORF Transcript_19524/g.40456 Transcript_19524/m.40456 type:complete len:130 (-) Transcript_19524:49-438(-)